MQHWFWKALVKDDIVFALSPGELRWSLYLVLVNSESNQCFRTRIFNLRILNDCLIVFPRKIDRVTCIQHATNIFWLFILHQTLCLVPGIQMRVSPYPNGPVNLSTLLGQIKPEWSGDPCFLSHASSIGWRRVKKTQIFHQGLSPGLGFNKIIMKISTKPHSFIVYLNSLLVLNTLSMCITWTQQGGY